MLTGIPSLQTLRSFEACARLGSFSQAAEELGITQGAVSQHVKSLEALVGCRLIDRSRRRATAEGLRLLEATATGLGMVAGAVAELRGGRRTGSLALSVLPGFAVKWLFPRLGRFYQRWPDLTISLAASGALIDFRNENVDMAIRYGRGSYSGLHVERLFEEHLFPVAAPSLLSRRPQLRKPADLSRHELLEDDIPLIDGTRPGWPMWFAAAGLPALPLSQRRIGQSNMVIQAAIEGRGVALGRTALVADDMSAGRLANPFGPAVDSPFQYYVVGPRQSMRKEAVRIFRDWLFAQAAATPTAANLLRGPV